MGKNRIIKILGNFVGNIVVHKILIKYTNKPESIQHLGSEVATYRDNTLEISGEFHWNEQDKEEIKQRALRKFEKIMENNYSDVRFPKDEIKKLIEETIEEIMV